MKCGCGNDFSVIIGSQVKTKNCSILTSMTTVVTAQCDKCKAVFQLPVKSGKYVSVKKE
tara:strand:+ start:1748 stop:1924 length:177 start_codon:yes stop_codon:yes gene_type:complete